MTIITTPTHTPAYTASPRPTQDLTLSIRDPSDAYAMLVEYLEENPLVLTRPGMASEIRNYYRQLDPTDTDPPRFRIGKSVLLGDEDESPFLGEIEPGQTIQVYA